MNHLLLNNINVLIFRIFIYLLSFLNGINQPEQTNLNVLTLDFQNLD